MAEETRRTDAVSESDEAKRVRMIIDSDTTLNAAVQLRASKESAAKRRPVSKSEVVGNILREALASEIQELDRFASEQDSGPKKPRRRHDT